MAAIAMAEASGAAAAAPARAVPSPSPPEGPTVAVAEGMPHAARLLSLASGDVRVLPLGLVPAGARDLRFSPDRRRIAYVGSGPDGPTGDTPRLWVVDVDGADRRFLSPPGVLPTDPAWSPDGTSIVYVDGDGLSLVNVGSGDTRRLRGVRGSRLWLPSFRPDGRAILFTRVADHGRHLEMWTTRVRGGPPHRFLRDAAFGSWSPDGSSVAFRRFGQAVRDGRIWPFHWGDVYLADRSGREIRRVASGDGTMMAPIEWSLTRPEWSPDGTRLVFVTHPYLHASVRVLDIRDGQAIHVACGTGASWWNARTLLLERPGTCRVESARAAELTTTRGW